MCKCPTCESVASTVYKALTTSKAPMSAKGLAAEIDTSKRAINHHLYSNREIYAQNEAGAWRAIKHVASSKGATKSCSPKPSTPARLFIDRHSAVRQAAPAPAIVPGNVTHAFTSFNEMLHDGELGFEYHNRRRILDSRQQQRNALLAEAQDLERRIGRFARDCSDVLSGSFKGDPTGIYVGNVFKLRTARMAVALYHACRTLCASATFDIGQCPRIGSNDDVHQLNGVSVTDGVSVFQLQLLQSGPQYPNAPKNQPLPRTIKAIGTLQLEAQNRRIQVRNENFVAEIGEANPPWIYDLLVTGNGVLRWPSRSNYLTFLFPLTP